MVSEKRQHPAVTLQWRECIDVWDKLSDEGGKPEVYWELIEDNADEFFCTQYAYINKVGDRRYVLIIHDRFAPTRKLTYHRTLKEAKAVGLVTVKFNLAGDSNGNSGRDWTVSSKMG